MNTAATAIIAAGIAVLGTLLSPIAVQYASARTKAQEYELARRQRQEEREAERRSQDFNELRSTYTQLNTEMRGFHRALNSYLHLIRSNHCNEVARDSLNSVRHNYLQCYADAQMIVPDKVLSAALYANGGLAQLYGMALRLDGFTVPDLSSSAMADDSKEEEGEEETMESAFACSEEVGQRIHKLRDIMRTELGISSAR
jgi:hypothetical protein